LALFEEQPREYEIKIRPPDEYSRNLHLSEILDTDVAVFELCSRLDSGTWLNDQERFYTWTAVQDFFRMLRLHDI
jgi:hypothetical protein